MDLLVYHQTRNQRPYFMSLGKPTSREDHSTRLTNPRGPFWNKVFTIPLHFGFFLCGLSFLTDFFRARVMLRAPCFKADFQIVRFYKIVGAAGLLCVYSPVILEDTRGLSCLLYPPQLKGNSFFQGKGQGNLPSLLVSFPSSISDSMTLYPKESLL